MTDRRRTRINNMLARNFRAAVLLASQPTPEGAAFLKLIKRVGNVTSGRRILEAGLPDDAEGGAAAIRVLMAVAGAVRAEVARGKK